MADIAPLAPSATDMALGTETSKNHVKARPVKPDEDSYKKKLEELEKAHSAKMAEYNAVKDKINSVQPAKDSPVALKQKELRGQLDEIKKKQSEIKASRGNVQDKLSSLDAQLKSRINEQKNARAKVNYKNVDEVERQIAHLSKQVDSGTMKLVDEKKALAEISALQRTKKSFAGFEQTEKQIADLKAQIADIKKGMDNPESRALSDRFDKIQKELNAIRSEQDDAFKNLNALRDQRTRLQGEQQETFSAVRAHKNEYNKQRNAFRDFEFEQRRLRAEKQKQERDAYNKEKRRKVAAEKLDEASTPAFLEQINSAENLIRYFDPSVPAEQKVLRGPSGFAAEAQRTVDGSQLKGKVLSKKSERQEESYFVGTGGKKGKKGKNSQAGAAASSEKLNLSIGIIEELGKVGLEPPSNQSEVPAIVEKLKEKVVKWKADQDKKTKENIAKAQAEIDRLEAEALEESSAGAAAGSNSHKNGVAGGKAHDSAKKPAQANQGLNGDVAQAELQQEADAVGDAADELKKARLGN